MQTKRQSLIEIVVMLIIKTAMMIAGQLIYFSLKGIPITLEASTEWAAIAFCISLIMSYLGRRFFNWFFHR